MYPLYQSIGFVGQSHWVCALICMQLAGKVNEFVIRWLIICWSICLHDFCWIAKAGHMALKTCSNNQLEGLSWWWVAQLWKNWLKIYLINRKSQKNVLSLHKLGIASPKQVNLLCIRLAPTLHKLGIASPKQVNLLCIRLAPALHKSRRLIIEKLYSVQECLNKNKVLYGYFWSVQ